MAMVINPQDGQHFQVRTDLQFDTNSWESIDKLIAIATQKMTLLAHTMSRLSQIEKRELTEDTKAKAQEIKQTYTNLTTLGLTLASALVTFAGAGVGIGGLTNAFSSVAANSATSALTAAGKGMEGLTSLSKNQDGGNQTISQADMQRLKNLLDEVIASRSQDKQKIEKFLNQLIQQLDKTHQAASRILSVNG